LEIKLPRIHTSKLNKGHQRKLQALRKSLGKDIADEAFLKWQKLQASSEAAKPDPHLAKLEKAVERLIKDGLKIPPRAIKITRGRGGLSVRKVEMAKRKKRVMKASSQTKA